MVAGVSAVNLPTSTVDLEAQIDLCWRVCTTAKDADVAREAFDRMRQLIKQRTPEQIERMERERGLRA